MFDKDLFLSLCEKYGVEISETATSPMIKEGNTVRVISDVDVDRIFALSQTYIGYSNNLFFAKVGKPSFCLNEGYAIAC